MNPNHDERGRFTTGESAASPGTEVRFAKALDPGDRTVKMRVIEDRGDRVLVEALGTGIKVAGSGPQMSYFKNELKITISGRKHNLSGSLDRKAFADRLPSNPTSGQLNALEGRYGRK